MQKLIVFGEDWGAHPSSTQYIINDLQSRYGIIWVNSIGLRSPRLTVNDIKRIYGKGWKIIQQFTSKSSGKDAPFPVVNSAALPCPGRKIARKINGSLIRKSIIPYIDNSDRPILWLSLPSAVDVIGKLNEKAVVYYCSDDFSSLAGVDHGVVSKMEKELSEKADLIIVVSEVLASKFPPEKTHVVYHGVDYKLFSTPQPRPSDLPEGKPIAGYYGSIAKWIDQDLLCDTAARLPHWNFVLIGPARVDFSRLKKQSNIHFLGPRPHDKLPGYIQHWQVALLPYKPSKQIQACNPLKLREYLASGTPVVSRYFPALKNYLDLVTATNSLEEYINAVDSFRNYEGKKENARMKAETWSRRANEVDELLKKL